jgi:hypothetical protein
MIAEAVTRIHRIIGRITSTTIEVAPRTTKSEEKRAYPGL